MNELDQLKNPIWHALQSELNRYAKDYGSYAYFDREVSTFGASDTFHVVPEDLLLRAEEADPFFVVAEQEPKLPSGLELKKVIRCYQMVCNEVTDLRYKNEIVKLEDEHFDDLWKLVKLVMPDYFESRTWELGDYYGIYQDGDLVSMAGERMRMPGLQEVSAVVTHPDHGGNGYAKQVVHRVTQGILEKGRTAFLHVYYKNPGAIGLYEKLGYKISREMTWWLVGKV